MINIKNYPSLASHRLAYKPDNECTFRESKVEECCTDNAVIKKVLVEMGGGLNGDLEGVAPSDILQKLNIE